MALRLFTIYHALFFEVRLAITGIKVESAARWMPPGA